MHQELTKNDEMKNDKHRDFKSVRKTAALEY